MCVQGVGDRLLSLGAGLGLALSVIGCAQRPSAEPIQLPTLFAADRIFVHLPTISSDTLVLYTDTGGGLFLFGQAADRLHAIDSLGIVLSAVAADTTFPDPLGTPDHTVPIYRPDEPSEEPTDGILGESWFANRIWTIDYRARKLLLNRPTWQPPSNAAVAPLGFLTDSTGERVLSFPRIRIVVDGDTLDMLFDTGATLRPTPGAQAALGGDTADARAASFISTGILEGWHARHPEWRVIPDGDRNLPDMRLIEVPALTIAGLRVGPVWFTERPDANFHDFMSQWMDRRVEGAVGGNVFRYFRVTVDYPGSLAYFEQNDAPQ